MSFNEEQPGIHRIKETAGEETEAKLRDFLRCELNIDYYIEFGNVHRFGYRQNNTNGTEIRPTDRD
jgi:hypothetical protein